jgi:hypothetical protein
LWANDRLIDRSIDNRKNKKMSFNTNTVMRWSEITENEELSSQAAAAPTIKNHSVTCFGDYLYCFGGYDGRRNHMTLLLYHIPTSKWIRPEESNFSNAESGGELHEQMPPQNSSTSNSISNNKHHSQVLITGTPPPGRNGHSATLAADPDSSQHARIIIIGGWLGNGGPLAASDMHILDIHNSNNKQYLRWYQPALKGSPPGPCNMHSADYVESRNEVYVFRGGNGREYLNDLHALDVNTLVWRAVETTGQTPQQRANHSSAMLEDELFIFGGWNGTERLNDIHVLDTKTSTWTCPVIGGVLPHPRAGMTLTALRGRLYLFGGSGTSAKCFNDLQILDRQQMAWLDVVNVESNSTNATIGNEHNTQPFFRFGSNTSINSHHFESAGAQDGNEEPQRSLSSVLSSVTSRDSPDNFSSNTSSIAMGSHQDASGGNLHDSYWNTPRLNPRSYYFSSPNPNDQDTVESVRVYGRGPGRRAGHTATAVIQRKIFIFGGSCGSDYLSDFFVLDTDPPPTVGVSEPTSLQLVERRLRHFCNDPEFSDVTFLVQGERIYGHKMILSIVSDCFRAMFTTGFRESNSNCCEIEIPDCSAPAFITLMEYIYNGRLPALTDTNNNNNNNKRLGRMNDRTNATRNLERIVELLELADRFFLDHLKQICEKLLEDSVTSDTVEYLLSISQKTNSCQLQAICEHFLRNRDSASEAPL